MKQIYGVNFDEEAKQYLTKRDGVYSIIYYVYYIIILKVRNQSIRSVGIKTDKILKSIFIGVIGSIPFSILNVIGPISSGKSLNPNIFD